MKSDTSRVPEGWVGLEVYGVYVKGNQLIVVGEPDEQSEHNCDAMGCGSLDHVLYRATLPKWQAVEQPRVPDVCPECAGSGKTGSIGLPRECPFCDGTGKRR